MTTEAVTVGQAAKRAGVPVEALRELCEARAVKAERTSRGHWHLMPEDIPSREYVGELLLQAYRASVADAQDTIARFVREVEAVQLDLNEAQDDLDGRARLGNDLRAVWPIQRPLLPRAERTTGSHAHPGTEPSSAPGLLRPERPAGIAAPHWVPEGSPPG